MGLCLNNFHHCTAVLSFVITTIVDWNFSFNFFEVHNCINHWSMFSLIMKTVHSGFHFPTLMVNLMNLITNRILIDTHCMWLFVEMILVCLRRHFWPSDIKSNIINSEKRDQALRMCKIDKERRLWEHTKGSENKMLFTIWITYIVWFIDSLSLLLSWVMSEWASECVYLPLVHVVYSVWFCIVGIAIHLDGVNTRGSHGTQSKNNNNNNKRLPFAFPYWTKRFFVHFEHLLRAFIFKLCAIICIGNFGQYPINMCALYKRN